jgi:integrase
VRLALFQADYTSRAEMAVVELPVVAKQLRHKSIIMTKRYVHLSGGHKLKALKKLVLHDHDVE